MASDDSASTIQVLYDGDCGICTQTARFLRWADRRRRLELVSFADARRLGLAREIPDEAFYKQFHALHGDTIYSGPDAIPVVLDNLPLGTLPARALRRSRRLRRVASRAYWWVAANRHLFGAKVCKVPSSPIPPKAP